MTTSAACKCFVQSYCVHLALHLLLCVVCASPGEWYRAWDSLLYGVRQGVNSTRGRDTSSSSSSSSSSPPSSSSSSSSSFSSSSLSHFYVGSIWDDSCLHAARSFTSYHDNLSDRLLHSPPTSSSVFIYFCFRARLYPSPSFLHTPHLFSSHAIKSCVHVPSLKYIPLSCFL